MQILAIVAISVVRLNTPEETMGYVAIVFSDVSVNPKPSPDGLLIAHLRAWRKGIPLIFGNSKADVVVTQKEPCDWSADRGGGYLSSLTSPNLLNVLGTRWRNELGIAVHFWTVRVVGDLP